MKKPLAYGTLLLLTTQLVAPAALAQSTSTQGATTVSPNPAQDDAGQEEEIEISTPGGAPIEGEIVVTGRHVPNVIRQTPQVISVLSSADIARTGEGDIASALTRVTGLSVVGNGFVYVRGLGDRYSSALLNGSPLPSPEPLRRSVPLDIFPTAIIGSALVQKSYSVNYAGEFGGGVVNLTTKAVPKESFFQMGVSAGFDTYSTSNLGYVYDGSSTDWLGFDGGERNLPNFLQDFINSKGTVGTGVFNSQQVLQMSNAPTTLLQANYHLPANWSGEMNFGHSIEIGGADKIGIVASANYSNNFKTRESTQQDSVDPNGVLRNDFRTVLTDNRVVANGLFGLGAELGEQKLRWTNVYIHDTVKQGRLATATTYVNSSGDPVLQQNTGFFERQLIDTQGVAELKFGDLHLDLRGSYANTQRSSPYERFFSYRYNTTYGAWQNSLNGLGEEATVAFSKLNEDLWSGQADLSYKLGTVMPVTLSAGYYYSDTKRESSRYDFRYRSNVGGGIAIPYNFLRPDYLLGYDVVMGGCPTVDAANPGCIQLRPSIGNDATYYEGDLTVHAGYGQVEFEPLDDIRATFGVRYEKGDQGVTTNSTTFGGKRLENDYWLPAATITWTPVENVQLRFHGSKTIARPQFRELAPQIYRDFDSDRLFFGNPQLVDSKLWNVEGRAEWFFARDQRVTAAVFAKKIDNPIEQVGFYSSTDVPLTTGFSYAPSARLWGAEFEVQKYFPLDFLSGDFFASRRIVAVANYTYTKSKIDSSDELVPVPYQNGGSTAQLIASNLLFPDGSPLTGQSEHLANLQLGIEDKNRLSQLTVLFNYASDRVTNRRPINVPGAGDIYESPGIRLDVVARQGIELAGAEFELKFEGRNLTRTKYLEYQDFPNGQRVYINRYNLGSIYTVGISTKFW